MATNKVKLTEAEWEDIVAQHKELDPEKPEGNGVEISYKDLPFLQKTQRVKVWILLLLSGFALVGAGFTGYQVYKHWLPVVLGLAFIGAVYLSVKIAQNDKRRK